MSKMLIDFNNINYTKFSFASVILCIWQLPQVLVSLFLLGFIHGGMHKYRNPHTGMTVWRMDHSFRSLWSLGPFIFVPDGEPSRLLKHETGHSVQSLYLGPLYLFVVGIPSAILLQIRRKKKKDEDWYYAHFPEGWANKLGGVNKGEVSE